MVCVLSGVGGGRVMHTSAFIPLLFHFGFVVSVSQIFENWGKYLSFFKVKAFSRYFWIAWVKILC